MNLSYHEFEKIQGLIFPKKDDPEYLKLKCVEEIDNGIKAKADNRIFSNSNITKNKEFNNKNEREKIKLIY